LSFRKLPLGGKLALIGILPMAFLVYLSLQVYHERTAKFSLFETYLQRMHRSAAISDLISNLQAERDLYFEFALNNSMAADIPAQKHLTDSSLVNLGKYDEPVSQIESYTFLDKLPLVRSGIESGHIEAGSVMDFYTSSIFRLNTLNSLPTGSIIFVKPVYRELLAQKLLTEIITYAGILSANFYNALYTKKYIPEILMGSRGVHDVYHSYITEYKLKASPAALKDLDDIMKSSEGSFTNNYIDTAFKYFKLDTAFSSARWRAISTAYLDKI
jgi:hypothetical protein